MTDSCYGCDDPNVIEYHHLIPRASGGGKHQGMESPLIPLCANCHSALHKMAKGAPSMVEPHVEQRLKPLVGAIIKSERLKKNNPEYFQDRELHTLQFTVTPRQLARLHKLKADSGFSSLDKFLKAVIGKLTGTA